MGAHQDGTVYKRCSQYDARCQADLLAEANSTVQELLLVRVYAGLSAVCSANMHWRHSRAGSLSIVGCQPAYFYLI